LEGIPRTPTTFIKTDLGFFRELDVIRHPEFVPGFKRFRERVVIFVKVINGGFHGVRHPDLGFGDGLSKTPPEFFSIYTDGADFPTAPAEGAGPQAIFKIIPPLDADSLRTKNFGLQSVGFFDKPFEHPDPGRWRKLGASRGFHNGTIVEAFATVDTGIDLNDLLFGEIFNQKIATDISGMSISRSVTFFISREKRQALTAFFNPIHLLNLSIIWDIDMLSPTSKKASDYITITFL